MMKESIEELLLLKKYKWTSLSIEHNMLNDICITNLIQIYTFQDYIYIYKINNNNDYSNKRFLAT